MEIQILTTQCSECDKFVQQFPAARMCHMPAWSRMIEQTFGHRGFYLVARNADGVQGILPLTQIKSRLFGNRMISQAFSNYGGVLANNTSVLKSLYDFAVELAKDNDCTEIEFRNIEPLTYDLNDRTDKITMLLPLSSNPDQLWQSFKPKVRNQVRKAKKSGLVCIDGQHELLKDFWHVWSKRMAQLGTPCYPRRLFYNILEAFPDHARVFLVNSGDTTVGAAFVYCFNGLVQLRWASTLIEYNKLCVDNLLYWTVMSHYCLKGASYFDFGRTTPESSHHRFKKQWGSFQVQLYYQYWSESGHDFSPVSPANPKYCKKVEIWKKLPLCLTRIIGSHISKNLP